MKKNWNYDVPETEEECREVLKQGTDTLLGSCLVGIFNCRLAQGDSVLEAYETTLKAHLQAAGIIVGE